MLGKENTHSFLRNVDLHAWNTAAIKSQNLWEEPATILRPTMWDGTHAWHCSGGHEAGTTQAMNLEKTKLFFFSVKES